MNVWFVNHYALPPSSVGITRHHDLAARLTAHGHDVSIVASSFDHYKRSQRGDGSNFCVEMVDGVRYCWVRTPEYGASTIGRSRNMVAFARRLASGHGRTGLPEPDIVIGSSPHLLTPWAARRVARKSGARFVFEIRDIWPDSLVELGGPPRWHPAIIALSVLERSLYRSADIIVSLLPGAAEHIRTKAGRHIDVAWIPNGTEVPDEPPGPKERGEWLEITYAGTIGHANALDVVIDAATDLENRPDPPKVRWRIVGLGPERERLEALTRERGLSTVTFDGPVPREQVPSVLAEADVCLLHLMDSPVFRWGVSPNKLFDYMRAAKPVLFAVRTGIDPVAEAGAGVSIAPSDPTALAEAARRLASQDQDELRVMGLNGFEYLRSNHDLVHLAGKYSALLDEQARTKDY